MSGGGAGGRGRATVLRDAVRTQLWPLPTAAVALALALGVGLPRLDARVDEDLPPALTEYLFGGGAGAARTVLDAIASSLVTVTSLTFSLTVVTLQLASSQFSPRLLRTFMRDRFVHVTLALFLATFTYALTVLRTVRSPEDGQSPFVPQISVTVAFVLALASVIGLVLFLAHLAREIRVETMLRNVHQQTTQTVRDVLPERGPGPAAALPVPSPDAVLLPAASSGFLVRQDEAALLAAAVEADVVLVVNRTPGSAVVLGTPVGAAWSRTGGPLSDATVAQLRDRVGDALTTGFERTAAQDVGFGLRQLTDVATKALSPGINDPTTAIHALGHSSALLCELAGRDLGPALLTDDQDRVRVGLARPDLDDLLELALAQPRRYGAADPDVLAQLFTLLRELAWHVRDQPPEAARVVAGQLARLQGTVGRQDFDTTENARLAVLAGHVQSALSGHWAVHGTGG